MIIHVVEPGDSLYKIGQEYGVSPYRLAIDNGIEYNSTLVIGQTIVVQFPTVVHTCLLYTSITLQVLRTVKTYALLLHGH